MAKNRLLFVLVVFVVLIVLAHGVAELKGYLDARVAAQAPGRPVHTVLYYRVIFTIWVTTILLTPALCLYLFTRSESPSMSWRALWTFSYAAFLFHLYWTIVVVFGLDWHAVFNSQEGVATDPEKVVEHPGPDLFLAVWWGFDVVLAWLLSSNRKWVQVQRGAVHLLVFVMFFGAMVLAAKASMVARLLGIIMALTVTASFMLRLIVRETDPKSFLMELYIRGFQVLNLFLPWYRLPTTLAVANLGALRDVLRAKNLHNTSDIRVTHPQGLRNTPLYDPKYLAEREKDGFYNDLSKPAMGSASLNPDDPTNSSDFTQSTPGARFGRNIPLNEVDRLRNGPLLEPNPRLISNKLLARPEGTFIPASTLNLLAAAWIQFQTHDWFNHGTPVIGNEFEVPLPTGDTWHQTPMRIRQTRPNPVRPNSALPAQRACRWY